MTLRGLGPGLVLAAAVAGIAVGEHGGPGPAGLRLLLAAVLLVAAVAVAIGRRGLLGLVCCCAAAGCGGSAVTARALDGQVHSPLATAVRDRAEVVAEVTLTTDPDATRFAARGLGRVDRAELPVGTVGGGRIVVLDAAGAAASRLAVLRAGDRVQLRGYLRPLDRFEARARWQHAVGALAADDVLGFAPAASPLMRTANWLRAGVLAGNAGVPEPQRALLAGFLLGDTTDLPDVVVADFRASGLSHLVAVSGQNVAFVLALVGPLLRRGHRAVRLLAGLGVVVVFAAMTRFEPSVLRASAMAGCSMVALAVGRPTAGLRALALAVTGLVLVDPFLVHSVGFLLSCAASVGIAWFAPAIAARLPGPRPAVEALSVTLGAQLAVAPVLLVVFDGVPLVSVPANLVVAPVAGPLTMLGLAGGVVGGVVGGPVGGATTFPAYLCASAVLLVARVAARVPLTIGARELGVALPGLVLAAAVFAAGRVRRATWRRARARAPRSRLAVPPR